MKINLVLPAYLLSIAIDFLQSPTPQYYSTKYGIALKMPFDLQPAPPSLVGLAGWLLALKGLALFMIMKTPHSRPSLYHSWMGKYTGHAAVHYKKVAASPLPLWATN